MAWTRLLLLLLIHDKLIIQIVTWRSLMMWAWGSIWAFVEDLALCRLMLLLLSMRLRLVVLLLVTALCINRVLSQIVWLVLWPLTIWSIVVGVCAWVVVQATLRSNFQDKVVYHWLTWLSEVSFTLDRMMRIEFGLKSDWPLLVIRCLLSTLTWFHKWMNNGLCIRVVI